jgi:hypothetical protein
LFSVVADPGLSGYGLPVVESTPVRGDAHCATNVAAGWNVPAVHEPEPEAPPSSPPPPQEEAPATAAATSQTLESLMDPS